MKRLNPTRQILSVWVFQMSTEKEKSADGTAIPTTDKEKHLN